MQVVSRRFLSAKAHEIGGFLLDREAGLSAFGLRQQSPLGLESLGCGRSRSSAEVEWPCLFAERLYEPLDSQSR